jgi:hypothetical protein
MAFVAVPASLRAAAEALRRELGEDLRTPPVTAVLR